MRFNIHSQLAGKHAFLSASKSSWINYDEDKLDRVFLSNMAAQRGTDLHALAAEAIRLGVRLPDICRESMKIGSALCSHVRKEYSIEFVLIIVDPATFASA